MLSKKSLTNKRVKTIIEVCVKKRIKKDKDDPVGGKPGRKGLSMKFLNKLERKFGRYAVPNLMTLHHYSECGRAFDHHHVSAGTVLSVLVHKCHSSWTDLAKLFHLFLCHTRQAC